MESYPKLVNAETLDGYNLLLFFSDGKRKVYDFTPNLSHPFYKGLQDKSLFRRFTVNDGELEWVTGQDFCPHTLYSKSVDYAG